MEQLSARLSRGIERTPFKNRPLALMLAVFLCAMLLVQISLTAFIIYAVLIILYSFKLAGSDGGFSFRKNPLVYLLPLLTLTAVLLTLPGRFSLFEISELVGERTVRAVITDVYYEERFGALYLAELIDIDGVAINGNITVEFTEQIEFSLYDTLTLRGIVIEAQDGFSSGELLLAKSRNIIADVQCTEVISVTNEAKSGFIYTTHIIRGAISTRLYDLLPTKVAGYASAILLGNKSGITDTFKSDMSALGISHILAVSGMHMSIIATAITLLTDKIKVSRKPKALLIVLVAVMFMTVVGFTASVVRAAIMLMISTLAVFAKGRADPITSLMLAGTIICIPSPQTVISCSFLLSFFATLGIVLCAVYSERRARARLRATKTNDLKVPMKIIKGVLLSLLISLCATLFTAPVMSVYFSEISFVSVFTNLFAVPMAFLSMVLTIIVLALGNVPLLGTVAIKAFTLLYGAFEALIKFLADTFTTTVSLRYPFFTVCLILLVGMTVFLVIKTVKNPLAYIASMVITALIFAGGVQLYSIQVSDRIQVVYATEKNSDALIVSSGSETLFVDIGNGSRKMTDYCLKIMENEYYETEFDGYMLTHYHSRHISTIAKTLRENRIKELYLPKPENERERLVYESIMQTATESKIVTYTRGEIFTFGQAQISTVDYTTLERSEHPVIAMKISSPKSSLVYLGASVTESNAYIEADAFLRVAGAIVCAAHGATVKQNDAFLSFNPAVPVYLSPYEEAEENILFAGGNFIPMHPDDKGYAVLRFSLAP